MLDNARTKKVGTPWKIAALTKLLKVRYGEVQFAEGNRFFCNANGKSYIVVHNFEDEEGTQLIHEDLHEDGFKVYLK